MRLNFLTIGRTYTFRIILLILFNLLTPLLGEAQAPQNRNFNGSPPPPPTNSLPAPPPLSGVLPPLAPVSQGLPGGGPVSSQSNFVSPPPLGAQGGSMQPVPGAIPPLKKQNPTVEDHDFTETNYKEYGDFHEEFEEVEETQFLRNGRFVGASLGLGIENVSGNRGALWQGGLPAFDLRLLYWFNMNVAMDLGGSLARHFFEARTQNKGHVDVTLVSVGLGLRYFIDVKNMPAAISFANPHLLAGFGGYNKTEVSQSLNTTEADFAIGGRIGLGVEFALKPKKLYFNVAGQMHYIGFKDLADTRYRTNDNIADLSGLFFTVVGSILFTW